MKKFVISKCELCVSDNLEIFNACRNEFKKEAQKNTKEFRKTYRKEVKKYDDLYIALLNGKDLIDKSVDRAIKFLVSEEILKIDKKLFYDKYGDYIRFEEYYNIVRQEDRINNMRDSQDYELQVRQSQRGSWQGGGFGVKGAIKGAMAAGALNMGNDFLHSIGDSNRRRQNERNISLEEREIFNNPKTISVLAQGVFNCTLNIFLGIINELQENRKMGYVDIQADEAKAMFNNIVKYKEKGSQEYVKGILDCILKNPYNFDYYEELLGNDCHNDEVINLAIYFGYYNEIHEIIDPILKEEEEARKKEELYKKCLSIYYTKEEIQNSEGKFDLRKEVDSIRSTKIFSDEPSIEDLKFGGYMIGKDYLEGICGFKVNYERAIFWIDKSAKEEYGASQTLLGCLFIQGKIVKQNIEEGLKLIKQAVKHNDPDGRIELGQIYLEGKYVERNTNEGLKLLESVIKENGDYDYKYKAAYKLGEIYRNGVYIKKDYEKAKHYYEFAKKSKENTKILAQERLKELRSGLGEARTSDEELIKTHKVSQRNKFRRNRIILDIVIFGAIAYVINRFISWSILKYGLILFFIMVLISLIKDELTGKMDE